MDFKRSDGLCIILTSLAKYAGIMDFIRPGRLWTILNSLVKIYRTYGLYMPL